MVTTGLGPVVTLRGVRIKPPRLVMEVDEQTGALTERATITLEVLDGVDVEELRTLAMMAQHPLQVSFQSQQGILPGLVGQQE